MTPETATATDNVETAGKVALDIVVQIPCLNEAETIAQVIGDVRQAMSPMGGESKGGRRSRSW